MPEFDELEAMKQIASALERLDDAARARALQWALSRFRPTKELARVDGEERGNSEVGQLSATGEYGSFAELFDAAHPRTEKDKALLAAYWMQVGESAASFQSQSLNDLLKDLGHGIGNITEALSALRDERPALILQLKKSGTSRQARKTYKLTQEGAKRVALMTNGLVPAEAP